jgi:hypothetical protein
VLLVLLLPFQDMEIQRNLHRIFKVTLAHRISLGKPGGANENKTEPRAAFVNEVARFFIRLSFPQGHPILRTLAGSARHR